METVWVTGYTTHRRWSKALQPGISTYYGPVCQVHTLRGHTKAVAKNAMNILLNSLCLVGDNSLKTEGGPSSEFSYPTWALAIVTLYGCYSFMSLRL